MLNELPEVPIFAPLWTLSPEPQEHWYSFGVAQEQNFCHRSPRRFECTGGPS